LRRLAARGDSVGGRSHFFTLRAAGSILHFMAEELAFNPIGDEQAFARFLPDSR
jgi:hypothetical protein